MKHLITRLEVCKTCGTLLDKHTIVTQETVKTAHLFIGAVFGLIVGLLIGVVFVICETAYIDYRARVEQYQIDIKIIKEILENGN